MNDRRRREIKSDISFFAVVFAVFVVFRTTAFAMYYIPSESMLPTLTVGDRITVNKFAYGYSRHSVPFGLAPDLPTADGRIFSALPARGDVVVFRRPKRQDVLIKRVVGLPGDRISIEKGRLHINGEVIDRRLNDVYAYREHRGDVVDVARFEETLGEKRHEILERSDFHPGDDFGPVVVPPNELFVMGDNRDNSLDSRYMATGVGFLPVDHLIGRAEHVAFSTNFSRRNGGLKTHKSHWFSAL